MKIITVTDYKELTVTCELGGELLRIPVSCNVRTLANGKRRRDEVVRSIPAGYPYDPVQFPKGEWVIMGVEWQKDYGFDKKLYGEVKIRTNAFAMLHWWRLDTDGDYLDEVKTNKVEDSGYLLHWAPGNTLGCINLIKQTNANALAKLVSKGDKLVVK